VLAHFCDGNEFAIVCLLESECLAQQNFPSLDTDLTSTEVKVVPLLTAASKESNT